MDAGLYLARQQPGTRGPDGRSTGGPRPSSALQFPDFHALTIVSVVGAAMPLLYANIAFVCILIHGREDGVDYTIVDAGSGFKTAMNMCSGGAAPAARWVPEAGPSRAAGVAAQRCSRAPVWPAALARMERPTRRARPSVFDLLAPPATCQCPSNPPPPPLLQPLAPWPLPTAARWCRTRWPPRWPPRPPSSFPCGGPSALPMASSRPSTLQSP